MSFLSSQFFIWIGILFCISQSAMFSGLNLAFFSITRLRLEVEAKNNNKEASRILVFRKDSNFLLATILWGNVAINVLLTLLSNSIMAGVTAFIFSTFLITFLGELVPQAYFSRHALKMAYHMSPILKFYQVILYPIAKPSAKLLDMWLGEESIHYFNENSLKHLILAHIKDTEDIDYVEGTGAVNFLTIDDLLVSQEGEPIDPDSIITIPFRGSRPMFPEFKKTLDDDFLKKIHKSNKKWVIITDEDLRPRVVMDADGFLRSALLDHGLPDPSIFSHRPIIIYNSQLPLGEIIKKMEYEAEDSEDDVIDKDIIILWGKEKRIITGADILGRLLRGIRKKTNKKNLNL